MRETLQAFRKKNDELQLIPIFEQEKTKIGKELTGGRLWQIWQAAVTPVRFIFMTMNMNVTRVTETWMRMR